MMKVVLDTNVLISATFWIGDSHKIARRGMDRSIDCFISPLTLVEYTRILRRDFDLNDERIQQNTDAILSFVTVTAAAEPINLVTEDPDDNHILEAGRSCRANYIITRDRHLLKFREFEQATIVTPGEFVQMVEKRP